MNSQAIKGRLNQHVKRRLQSQESTENKIATQLSHNVTSMITILPNIKEEPIENTSVKSTKKRKLAKKSSTHHSHDSNPDDDDKCDKRNEKQDTGLDILTLILNYKKAEFLRNPQISELLDEINKKKAISLSELIQN